MTDETQKKPWEIDYSSQSPSSELKPWEVDWTRSGESKQEKDQGDFGRGFGNTFKQLPQLGYGLLAGAGSALESTFGEGGISSGIKKAGVKGYKEWGDKLTQTSKASDEFTYSYEKAKEGDFGALVDWLQYGIGYAAGQGVQAVVTGGVGKMIGQAAIKGTVGQMAEKMVAKEVAQIAESQIGKELSEEAIKRLAISNVAGNFGQTAAIGAQAFGMEGGEIFGDLSSRSVSENRALTGEELARAAVSTLFAGGLEFVGDKVGLDLLLGKSPLLKPAAAMQGMKGRVARGAIAAAGAAPIEGGTEYAQTLIEEAGKGNDPFSEESFKQAKNAAALGVIGGVSMGGVGGLINSPAKRVSEPDTSQSDIQADPLFIENKPDPLISFPDGSVGKRGEAEAYVNSLPEDQRVVARASLFGYKPQVEESYQTPEAVISSVTSAPTVDDAIAQAQKIVSSSGANWQNNFSFDVNSLISQVDDRDTVIQNRNRNTAGSVVQMNSIAAAPDYGRLSISRDFGNGAPVVFAPLAQPQGVAYGNESYAVAADGRKIPFQYAVVEAADILPSNKIDGSVNPEYATGIDGKFTAINNGRSEALREAYRRNTANDYMANLMSDQDHGISASEIAQFKQPVLVREMPRNLVTSDIGDISNTRTNADLSPIEQARNDSQRINIAALTFDDSGVSLDSTRQFINSIPEAEAAGLRNPDGSPTRQANDRIMAAVFHTAYENPELVSLYAQATDPEVKNVLSAMAMAAPTVIETKGAGDFDIRSLIADAAQVAVNAKRNGVKLSDYVKNQDFTLDAETLPFVEFIAENIRSPKKISEGFDALAAAMVAAHNASSQESMFETIDNITREQVLNKFRDDYVKQNEGSVENDSRTVANPVATQQAAIDAGSETSAIGSQAEPIGPTGVEAEQPTQRLSPQEISLELDKISFAVQERTKDFDLTFDDQNEIKFMTPEEKARRLELILQLPSSGELQAEAKQRIQDRIAARKQIKQSESDFTLESETPGQVRAAIAAQELVDSQAAASNQLFDKTQRQAGIDKEIQARQAASAENFELGQNADESLSGQSDIFKSQITAQPIPFRNKTDANIFRFKNAINGTPVQTELGWQFEPNRKSNDREKVSTQDAVNRLNAALAKSGERVAPIFESPSKEHALAKELGRAFGINVHFVAPNNSFDGVAHQGNVFLSSEMEVQSSSPELAIAGHEMLHVLEQENPELGAKMRNAISQYLKDGVIDARQLRESKLAGREVSESVAKGEVIADINGAMWLDAKFWRELRDADRNLFRRAAYLLMETLTKAIKVFTGSRFDAANFVTDVEAVRKILVQVWAERNQLGDLKSASASSELAFSSKENLENEPEEITIEAPSPPIATGEEIERAASLFLSTFPEGTTRHIPNSPTARKAKQYSEEALHDIGGDPESEREVASKMGAFSGYQTQARIEKNFYGDDQLVIEVFGKEQIENMLDEHPALQIDVQRDGEFSIYAPPSTSDTYKEFVKLGWAEPAKGKNGEVQYFTDENGGFWTRLTGFKTSELIPLLGDIHARARAWTEQPYFGLHWQRTTGASGGIDGHRAAILFSRKDKDKVEAADVGPLAQKNSNDSNVKNSDIQYSRKDSGTWYYSQLSKSIAEAPDKIFGAPKQIAAWLESNSAKLGIKKDEMQWSGVSDWLNLQTGKVSKQDVLDYLSSGGVKVQEVLKGNSGKPEWKGNNLISTEGQAVGKLEDSGSTYKFVFANGNPMDTGANRLDKAVEFVEKYLGETAHESEKTKYHSYQLPGGENYRELLLTLPDTKGDKLTELLRKRGFLEEPYISQGRDLPDSVMPEWRLLNSHISEVRSSRPSEYRSTHWDEKNILAHVRFNDRADADGNKVLFIEELQSDWGQDGLKKGFKGSAPTDKEVRDFFELEDNVDPSDYRQEMIDHNDYSKRVAPAPFVTKTESWLQLGIKRMIAYAVEHGYSKVAFVNGEQSASRYDLTKHIDEISYLKKPDGSIATISATKDGSFVFDKHNIGMEEVAATFGKEIAKKIESSEGHSDNRGRKVLEGVDLKVGGEGMKSFYDKIVPQNISDVLKKIGGGRVENSPIVFTSNLDVDYTLNQPSFLITEAMRQKVNDGLPLFSRKETIVGDNKRERTPEQLRAFKNVGRTVEVPTLKERWDNLTNNLGKKLAQGIVDQFAPIKDLSKNAYMLMRLSKGASGAFEAMLKGGQLKLSDGVYDFDDKKRGGVVDRLLVPLQGEADDFMWWVAGNRAERLAMKGKERLFSPQDISAFKTLANGDAAFDYKIQHGGKAGKTTRNRKEIYQDSLITFNEFNRNTLDMAEQSGLIDGESRKHWEDEFYVPFYRVSEESEDGVRGMNIKSGTVRQQAFKKLKGGSDKLNSDLLENTMMNWAHLLDAAAKNRAAKATLEAAQVAGIAEETDSSAKKTVWFMDGDKKRYFLVEDAPVLAAIQGLEYAGMRNPLMNAMSAMKHAMTMGVTASPFFKVRNLIRDSVSAIGLAELSYNPLKNIKEGYIKTDPKSDDYFRLLAGGGTIHFGSMLEGSESKRVRKLVESGVDESTILRDESAIKSFYRQRVAPMVDAYNKLGNRGEAINRAALYDQLRKQGKSHAEASLMARDLMDFSMQGAWTSVRFLTQVVPFMNARLQGLYKLGRSAKEDPRRFANVLGGVAMASITLMMIYGDDDDWKKREDWDRDNFWWFKVGGVAYRIPKPFEIGAIGTLAERGVEYFSNDEMTGKRFKDRLFNLLGDNLSMNPIPQMVKPILDVYSNKDAFTGRPIESLSMERLKSDYRFNGNTSIAARGISTVGNAITDATVGKFLSPVQVDHMIRGYFGWLGSFVVGASDKIVRPMLNEPTAATPDYWKVASGGLIADTKSASSRYVTQMYEQAKVLEEAYGTWQMLRKTGKLEEANEFAQENMDQLRKYKSVEAIKRSESKLNENIRVIERSNLSSDEKRARIQQIQERKDAVARLVS